MRFETTVAVDAAPGTVWAVLTDVESWPLLTASMTSVERLDPGPLHPGSRVRIRQPRLPVAEWTVTEVIEGRRFTWAASAVGVRTTAVHEVLPDGGSSRLRLALDQGGVLGDLAGRLAGRLIKRYVQMEAAGIKARSEAGA